MENEKKKTEQEGTAKPPMNIDTKGLLPLIMPIINKYQAEIEWQSQALQKIHEQLDRIEKKLK